MQIAHDIVVWPSNCNGNMSDQLQDEPGLSAMVRFGLKVLAYKTVLVCTFVISLQLSLCMCIPTQKSLTLQTLS